MQARTSCICCVLARTICRQHLRAVSGADCHLCSVCRRVGSVLSVDCCTCSGLAPTVSGQLVFSFLLCPKQYTTVLLVVCPVLCAVWQRSVCGYVCESFQGRTSTSHTQARGGECSGLNASLDSFLVNETLVGQCMSANKGCCLACMRFCHLCSAKTPGHTLSAPTVAMRLAHVDFALRGQAKSVLSRSRLNVHLVALQAIALFLSRVLLAVPLAQQKAWLACVRLCFMITLRFLELTPPAGLLDRCLLFPLWVCYRCCWHCQGSGGPVAYR